LIELLVVIAIIALLVSILLPSLNRAKALAKGAVCGSQLRNVGMANQLYVSEFSAYHVPAWAKGGKYWPGSGAYWFDIAGFRELFGVPLLTDLSSAPWQSVRSNSDCVSGYYPQQYLCPDAARALSNHDGYPVPDGYAAFWQSYGMNMNSDTDYINGRWDSNNNIAGIRADDQENPSGTIHFADSLTEFNPFGGHEAQAATEGGFAWYYGEKQALGWGGVWAWRHSNHTANLMFFDGHVEKTGRSEALHVGDSAVQKMWDSQMEMWTY
jgi:prepilin-type processing-associated H-X9-DG protein